MSADVIVITTLVVDQNVDHYIGIGGKTLKTLVFETAAVFCKSSQVFKTIYDLRSVSELIARYEVV